MGLSPVDTERPLSAWPVDSSDELPRLYYKGTQHFYKDLSDKICQRILINLHKPSFGTGK